MRIIVSDSLTFEEEMNKEARLITVPSTGPDAVGVLSNSEAEKENKVYLIFLLL